MNLRAMVKDAMGFFSGPVGGDNLGSTNFDDAFDGQNSDEDEQQERGGWTEKSFTMMLQLLGQAFPKDSSWPKSSSEAKKIIKALGLHYEKIHEKFEFPHTENTVDWILKNLNKRWRDWKGSLKASYYIPKGKQRVLSKPPKSVLEEQWPGLVRQWYDPRKEEKTHTKKDGSYVSEEAQKKLEEAHKLQSNSDLSSTSNQRDINEMIFRKVYGLGPTPSRVFGVKSNFVYTSEASSNVGQETELVMVKDELAEIKVRYAKLSDDFDMKEAVKLLMAERATGQYATQDQVGDAASIESHSHVNQQKL
ncbi:Transposase, Ptta/En/Spm, plant [Corchorus capsularis]|uniref:Transposase, Ptta/En/Spm, plant n=1 Tax=Corchorus capsularis TaxID=210143 RepID=A0A1R3H5F0_COCAP|nr:Transposase, Ptta/En/Spm, plant [Corchorus capsularis]